MYQYQCINVCAIAKSLLHFSVFPEGHRRNKKLIKAFWKGLYSLQGHVFEKETYCLSLWLIQVGAAKTIIIALSIYFNIFDRLTLIVCTLY